MAKVASLKSLTEPSVINMMKTIASLSFLLYSLSLASASPILHRRQSQAATPWVDPYNPEPIAFTARAVGQCSVQLSFQRGRSDTGYTYTFEAVYPDGSRQAINAKGDDRLSYSKQYVTPDGYRVDVSRFDDTCKGSTAPSAIVTYADSGSSRETVYRYNTQPVSITSDALPALPSNVTGRIQGRDTVVTWSPIAGVESYYILAEYSIESEAGPLPYIRSDEVSASDRTSWTLEDRKADTVIVVGKDSQGVITSIKDVYDVEVQ